MCPHPQGEAQLSNCDECKGLILSDHSSKAIVGFIKEIIELRFCKGTSVKQFGAVASRGTDVALNVVQSVQFVAEAKKWSVFLLFLGSSKAFDKIVRELVLGWPDELARADVDNFCMDKCAADNSVKNLKLHGPVLSQWGAPAFAIALLRTLHMAPGWNVATWNLWSNMDLVVDKDVALVRPSSMVRVMFPGSC